ncbi:MAG: hypothetical protein Q9222_000622 [Ikaeria aurantiellina]
MPLNAKAEKADKIVMAAPSYETLKTENNHPRYGFVGITTSTQPTGASGSSIDVEKLEKASKPAGPDPTQFPDGELQAWLVTLGCWCVFFVSWGPINTIGIFQEYYQRELLRNHSPSSIAWISSTKLFIMYGGGIIFGKLFDSYGPRWLLLLGSVMHVFGFMMSSLATEYYQVFLSQAICSALGASCIYYACAGSITTWFLKRRSTAFGIAATGSSVGGVVLPIMVSRLIPKVGYPWTMRIVGFLILGFVIVINITVKSRITHTPKPLQAGEYIKPLTEPTFIFVSLSMTLVHRHVANVGRVPGTYPKRSEASLTSSTFGKERAADDSSMSSTPGRIIPGVLADKIGNFNVSIITMVCSGVITLALWLPGSSDAAIIVYTVVFGAFSGSYIALAPMLIAQISKIQQIGIRNGLAFFIISFAALTGGPLGGALLDDNDQDFKYLQIFAGAAMCAAAALMAFARAFALGFKVSKV